MSQDELEPVMMNQHYALFDTAIGTCGIAWGPRGIKGVQLPMGSAEKTAKRIRRRHGEISEAEPTADVQRAIDRIVELLKVRGDDLTDIALDHDAVTHCNSSV